MVEELEKTVVRYERKLEILAKGIENVFKINYGNLYSIRSSIVIVGR